MSIEVFGKGRLIAVACVGVLVAGAGVWGLVRITRDDKPKLPKELSVDSLRAASEDPSQMRDRMRDAFSRDDLTDEQRRQLRENMREVWRARNQERLDEYFAANETQQKAILDREIDQMQVRMKEFQARRAEWERERSARQARDGDGNTERPNWRENFTPPTRQQRQERSEARDPDEMARQMAYFSALRKRAEERGVEMGFGRGFGPGGGRGGPGGPGGGRRGP